MMNFKNPAFYTTLINAMIIAIIGIAIFKTGNIAALIGLTLLQETPIIDPTLSAIMEAQTQDDEAEDDSGGKIGFTAEIK